MGASFFSSSSNLIKFTSQLEQLSFFLSFQPQTYVTCRFNSVDRSGSSGTCLTYLMFKQRRVKMKKMKLDGEKQFDAMLKSIVTYLLSNSAFKLQGVLFHHSFPVGLDSGIIFFNTMVRLVLQTATGNRKSIMWFYCLV